MRNSLYQTGSLQVYSRAGIHVSVAQKMFSSTALMINMEVLI